MDDSSPATASSQLVERHSPLAGALPAERLLHAGNLCLDLESHRLTVDGRPAATTHQEFQVLRILLNRRNEIIMHRDLCLAIWGSYGAREGKRLSVIMSRLRRKLADSEPFALDVVRSRGYGLIQPSGYARR